MTSLPLAPPAPLDAAVLAGGTELVATLDDLLETDRRNGTATALLLLAADTADTAGTADSSAEDDRPIGEVVARLRSGMRATDGWFPLDARHVAVVLPSLPPYAAEGVVERVTDTLLMALELSERTCPETVGVRVSIGASLAVLRAHDGRDAFVQAADALEVARADGGHCARIRTR